MNLSHFSGEGGEGTGMVPFFAVPSCRRGGAGIPIRPPNRDGRGEIIYIRFYRWLFVNSTKILPFFNKKNKQKIKRKTHPLGSSPSDVGTAGR